MEQEILKEFDEKFTVEKGMLGITTEATMRPLKAEYVKSFIRDLVEKAREEGWKKGLDGYGKACEEARAEGYKQGNLEAINGTYERQEVIRAEERAALREKLLEELPKEIPGMHPPYPETSWSSGYSEGFDNALSTIKEVINRVCDTSN